MTKYVFGLAFCFSASSAFATPAYTPGDMNKVAAEKLTCEILVQIENGSVDTQTVSIPVQTVKTCGTKKLQNNIAGTDMDLQVGYAAPCRRREQSISMQIVSASGQFAQAFALDEAHKQQSLQLGTLVSGVRQNVIAHCEAK